MVRIDSIRQSCGHHPVNTVVRLIENNDCIRHDLTGKSFFHSKRPFCFSLLLVLIFSFVCLKKEKHFETKRFCQFYIVVYFIRGWLIFRLLVLYIALRQVRRSKISSDKTIDIFGTLLENVYLATTRAQSIKQTRRSCPFSHRLWIAFFLRRVVKKVFTINGIN